MTHNKQIPEDIYKIAATAVVMSGHDGASSGMSGHHYERTRIMLRKDIKEFLESEGLDISTVVNRLLENFVVAYKAFWSLGAPGLGFEPRSPYGHQLSRPMRMKLFNFREDLEEFGKWLKDANCKIRIHGTGIKKKPVKEEVVRDYINKLDKVFDGRDIYSIADLESLVEALRRYMQFLFTKNRIREEEYYTIVDAFAEIKPTGSRDIDLKPEEIQEAYNHLKQAGNKHDILVFKLLVYSGLRLAHLLEVLWNWKPENVKIHGKVAVYRVEAVIEGNKKAFVMLFPADMLDEIERLPETYTYNVARKRISYGRISAITIRHWHYNFMILDNGIPEGVANFIQGRSPENVGSANYLAKIRGAVNEYAKLVDRFPI